MPLSSDSPIADRLQNGNNLLHTCTDLAEAKRLIADGVDPNAFNARRQTPLHALMRLGNPNTIPVVLYLASLNMVNVNAIEPDGTTVAHLCEHGPLMTALVNRMDFDPNLVRLSDGNTPLMLSVTYPKHPDIAKRLLSHPRIYFEIINPVNEKTALQLAQDRADTDRGAQHLALIQRALADQDLVMLTTKTAGAPIVTAFSKSDGVSLLAAKPATRLRLKK